MNIYLEIFGYAGTALVLLNVGMLVINVYHLIRSRIGRKEKIV